VKALVLYYSNTGNTQKVAKALADRLGAELAEVTCPAYLNWYGPLAMAWDIFTRHRPTVNIVAPKHARHDLIVVGGPVWAARAAPPIMSAIRDLPGEFDAVALFVTCSGNSPKSPPEPAIAEMTAAAPTSVLATQILREDEIRVSGLAHRVEIFAAMLRDQLPA
jgi:hypothetical protein